jgi:CheY-like chemotaxis protein
MPRILLVDDDRDGLLATRLLIERYGGECESVNSGADALAQAQAAHRNGTPFDVVMMDVAMPGMDGFETTRGIRTSLPEADRPRIVGMTAYTMESIHQKGLEAGMERVVTKPFFLTELLEAAFGYDPRERVA